MNRFKLVLLSVALLTSTHVLAKVSHQPPQDPAVVNRERIAYWLHKNGQLTDRRNDTLTQHAVNRFIGKLNTAPNASVLKLNAAQERVLQKQFNNRTRQKADNKTVKVLAVLVDFPDLPYNNNRLSRSDTAMYYSSYSRQHYQDMLFANNGYVGPNGENLKTVYQYYQQESGNGFAFTGQVFDWVTASKEAKYYGGDQGDNKDVNVTELIKEAVTKAVATHSINLADYDVEDPFDRDEDGIIAEPDNIIDHVLVFHSSVGQDSGGGVLGTDAIWAHQFYIDFQNWGYPIGTTGKSVMKYAIQAIDSAIGVVAHEFGHDLGLPDEYDTASSAMGEPIGMWSIMSGGSWAGTIPGSEPTSFSAYAREYLQQTHGGNWINQTTLTLSELRSSARTIALVDTNSHNAINQLRINLPGPQLSFTAPYAGDYQYYSGLGHNQRHTLSFEVDVPAGNPTLSMKAHWSIEADFADGRDAWDYVRVYANSTPLAGNHTVSSSSHTGNLANVISGKSLGRAGAEGALGWVDLEFSLAAFANQRVTFLIEYVTDPGVNEYGFVADNIRVINNGSNVYSDTAEAAGTVVLDGFERTGITRIGAAQNYWLQLRSARGNDQALTSEQHDSGIVLWFNNPNYSDNNSGEHPGFGFLSVVDADQNVMKNGSTILDSGRQVKDAAFSRLPQMSGRSGDTQLTAVSDFDDARDYSAPLAKEAGTVLPKHGVVFNVSEQAADSSTATVQLSASTPTLTAAFTVTIANRVVTISNQSSGGVAPLRYEWNFGDGSALSSELTPTHSYAADGRYTISVTVRDEENHSHSSSQTVIVAPALVASFTNSKTNLAVQFSSSVSGGVGPYSYQWNFGDGSTSSASNPTHQYASAGSYTVTLTVTDSLGSIITANQSVNVSTAQSSSGGGGGGVFVIFMLPLLLWWRRR